MAEEKRRVKVVIDEKEYTIVSNKSVAHIELVAETVNKQLQEMKDLSTGISKEELAILIAVNAVSDQIESHTKMIEMEENANQL